MSFPFHSVACRSEMMLHIRGCALGLAIALAGVSTANAMDQSDAEVTTDAEMLLDEAVDAVLAEEKAAEQARSAGDRSQGTGSLSVDPTGDMVYPAGRPDWVDQGPSPDNKPTVWPIKSLLSVSPEKAKESLEIQVQGAMAAYAELALKQRLGDEAISDGAADRLIGSKLLEVNLDSGSVRRYSGTVEVDGVTVYEEAAELTFDEKFDRRLERAWKAEEVEDRLGVLGVVGGTGLCLLMAGTGLVRRIARKHQIVTAGNAG